MFKHLALILFLSSTMWANHARGDKHLEQLYSHFIAPCCWQDSLLEHSSPLADEVRTEIKAMVAGGRTDEQIKDALVAKYSMRILTEPEGVRGIWLSWMPVAMIVVGVGVVGLVIQRMRREPVEAIAGDLPNVDLDLD